MNTTQQISPETVSLIESYAEHLGLSADEYIRRLLPVREGDISLRDASPIERAEAFKRWVASHRADTPVILDDRREMIY